MPAPSYTKELADEIVERMGKGETLADICRSDHMPAYRTVSDWRAAHPEFDAGYLAARDAGYDVIANRTRMTARGKKEEEGGDSSGDVARDRLIIDTDLKLLSKWDSRRYGDKTQVEHSGRIESLTDDQINERLAALMAKAEESE